MKAAEREVVVKVIGKAVRSVRADYEKQIEGLKEQVSELRSLVEAQQYVPDVVKGFVDEAFEAIPKPRDGNDVTDEQVERAVFAYFEANPVRVPEDGKSVTVEEVMPELKAEARAAVADMIAALPAPKDGQDATDEQVSKAVAEYLTENPPPAGESVTVEQVMPELRAELKKALESLPTVDDVLPSLLDEAKSRADELLQGIPLPKDGTSVTLEDVEPLLKSMQAEWALDFERRAHETVQRAIDRMPLPKDGKDALSLKDFEMSLSDDCRTMTVSLTDGENTVERSIHFPALVYQGVWKQGDEAKPGDVKTYDGSMWVCLKETKGKPGEYSGDWRLAVKRGRNGKSEK